VQKKTQIKSQQHKQQQHLCVNAAREGFLLIITITIKVIITTAAITV